MSPLLDQQVAALTILEATAIRARLNAQERRLRDAGHLIENALRNARIAKVGSGILHRTPPPYGAAVADVTAAIERAGMASFMGQQPSPQQTTEIAA